VRGRRGGNESGMALSARLDAFQRRHRRAGFPLAVAYKFVDDQGSYLSALIAYYGFLSLFPLLLLLVSVLGVVLAGHPALQQHVLSSALSQFPVVGTQLGDPKGLGGHGAGIAVGVLGTLYGGLGVAQAAQNAMNVAWAVPRHRRPNPLKARLRSLLLLAVVGLGVLGTTVLSALGGSAAAFGADLGTGVKVLVTLLSVVVNAAVFVLGFRVATARGLPVRSLLPGACVAAVGWQLLQFFGTAYVGHVVKNASATNGVFAFVLGLIAWMYLAAVVVVLGAEVNVVRGKHLYPRALLTPFTDDVELTPADERAYTSYAKAQRYKGFEQVAVSFDEHPTDAGEQPGEQAQDAGGRS